MALLISNCPDLPFEHILSFLSSKDRASLSEAIPILYQRILRFSLEPIYAEWRLRARQVCCVFQSAPLLAGYTYLLTPILSLYPSDQSKGSPNPFLQQLQQERKRGEKAMRNAFSSLPDGAFREGLDAYREIIPYWEWLNFLVSLPQYQRFFYLKWKRQNILHGLDRSIRKNYGHLFFVLYKKLSPRQVEKYQEGLLENMIVHGCVDIAFGLINQSVAEERTLCLKKMMLFSIKHNCFEVFIYCLGKETQPEEFFSLALKTALNCEQEKFVASLVEWAVHHQSWSAKTWRRWIGNAIEERCEKEAELLWQHRPPRWEEEGFPILKAAFKRGSLVVVEKICKKYPALFDKWRREILNLPPLKVIPRLEPLPPGLVLRAPSRQRTNRPPSR